MKERKVKMKRMMAWLLAWVIIFSMIPLHSVNAQSKSGNFSRAYSLNGDGAHDIVAVARAQANRTKAQMGYTEAWCADFVSDSAKLAGVSNVIPFNANCGSLRDAVIKAGGKSASAPQAGDLVFYYCKNCARYVHVGLMTGSNTSVQGNYDGKVTDNVRQTVYTDSSGHSVAAGRVSVSYVRPVYKNSVSDISPSPAPVPGPVDNTVPEPVIGQPVFDDISSEGFTLHVSVRSAALVKINVESLDTMQTLRKEYTSNLENISYHFDAASLPSASGKYHAFIYAYSYVNGKYCNERVHKLLYGNTADVVTLPPRQWEGCVDRLPSLRDTMLEGWFLSKNAAEKMVAIINGRENEIINRHSRDDLQVVIPGYDTSVAGFSLDISEADGVVQGQNKCIVKVLCKEKWVEIFNGTFESSLKKGIINEHNLMACVDQPLGKLQDVLSGWILTKKGILKMEADFNGEINEIVPEYYARQDLICVFPEYKDTVTVGFKLDISDDTVKGVKQGKNSYSVRILTDDGIWTEIYNGIFETDLKRGIILNEYNLMGCVDKPLSKLQNVLSGWILTKKGILKMEALFNGDQL